MFRKAMVLFVSVTLVASLGCLTGCEGNASVSVGGKAFYPNKGAGKNNDLGDPRKGMYDGSGFGESHSAGSQVGRGPFNGLQGGEK